MSWKTQARDSKGRFLPKVAAPTPPKVTRKKKEVIKQFNIFVVDDSASIRYNGMVGSIKEGFDQIVNDVNKANNDGKIEMYWGINFFGKRDNMHYAFGNNPFSIKNYNPEQGWTALNDGIIYAINKTQEYLNTIGKANVVLNIFTDGDENNSRASVSDVNKLVEQKKSEGWMINFIGGGDEKFVRKTAENYGIFQANTVSYGTNAVETTQVFAKMSAGMSGYTKAVKQRKATNQGFFGK